MTQIRNEMHAVYERQAERFDRNRDRSLFEKKWLDAFIQRLPEEGNILDVGCGTGKPIADYLIQNGFKVTGVDYSAAMLAIAKETMPACRWIEGDMRSLNLEEKFDGVIAWNSFFHLTPDEQMVTLPKLLDHVKLDGSILTTIGNRHGETDGYVGGEPVYHGSLSVEEYEKILTENQFGDVEIKLDDPDCNLHCVLLATKAGEQS